MTRLSVDGGFPLRSRFRVTILVVPVSPNPLFADLRLTKQGQAVSLKTVTSLNKESRLLNFHFSYAIVVFGNNELKCSKCYDRKDKLAFRTYKCCGR